TGLLPRMLTSKRTAAWRRQASALSTLCPALGPGRVLLSYLLLGQAPSLHHLRSRTTGLVRQLRRYYEPVRPPLPVHHRRTAFRPSRCVPPTFDGRAEDLPVLAHGVSVHARG